MTVNDRKTAEFRFYEELNDFLPLAQRKVSFSYPFSGTPAIKDAVEAIGVPHTEIELIVVNGESVGWDYRLRDGDRVGVFPVFESLDVAQAVRLREAPLRHTRFVVDVHLGKLARLLRMLGLDTAYRRDYSDAEIVRTSAEERRIVLTRDRGILKTKQVTHGYWVRSSRPEEQLREVFGRFDLAANVKPFSRCMVCNGMLERVEKQSVLARLPRKTAAYFDEFYRCGDCGKVYWKGSHYEHMKKSVRGIVRKVNLDS
jgi:uncharacterized protein with PIN domain